MGNINTGLSQAVSYTNSLWSNSAKRDSVDRSDEYRDREQYKICPLIEIIPELLHHIDKGLRKDIANIIISFMVAVDLTMYLSKQLTLDYIAEDLAIYDFSEKECRKKHRKTRAFIVEGASFAGDEVVVHSPLHAMDSADNNMDVFEYYQHKLPEKYKQIISQNKHITYVKLGKKFKKIPQHIFWWKAIEDEFKDYFVKQFDFNKDIASYIECNGVSELRKHGFLHVCVEGPPLYDSKTLDEKWYIEFFALCTNVEAKQNRNSFPSYVIENKDRLVFEVKVVTYSNEKDLGLHMPRHD